MSRRLSWPALLSRWVVGLALVSWRYLWQTTPLHRSQQRAETGDLPPDLADGVSRDGWQPWDAGWGDLFHRTFRVRILDPAMDARRLMRLIQGDFEGFVPREVVRVHGQEEDGLEVGEDLVVDMPGPWNGPVRVVALGERELRLATLRGHLEAGVIEFRARDERDALVFEIEAWARPASRLVDLLYARLRLAKEVQLNMWVRFCRAAARRARGRLADGVEIITVTGPPPAATARG